MAEDKPAPGTAPKGASLPVCNALWIGGELPPIAAACLASFARKGHRVILHLYGQWRHAPPGVEIADAARTVSADRIVRYRDGGSYALFSNLFRYELLRRDAGIWIDCDMYCVRPIDFGDPYIFGWQEPQIVNGAILRLPPDTPVLDEMIALFAKPSPVPPWLEPKLGAKLLARKFAGEAFTVEDLPWGTTGPMGLTYLLNNAGLTARAKPRQIFYPLVFLQGPRLLKAGADLAGLITADTRTVHLWNEGLARHLDRMETGSAIHRLLTEGTLFDESRLAAVA